MGDRSEKPRLKNVDQWLDLALRERANAEPRSGLEERVLRWLAADPPKPQFAWWLVWAAAAAIVVIVLTLALMRPNRQAQVAKGQQNATGSPDTRPQVTLNQRSKTTEPQVASSRDAACCVSTSVAAGKKPQVAAIQPRIPADAEPLPKLATFPAPRPETTQERLLVQLAAQPSIVEAASLSSGAMPLKELSIPELKIDPMEGTPPDESPQN